MSDEAISFGDTTDVTEIEGTSFTPTKLDESSIKKKIGHDIYTDVTQAFDEMVSNAFSGIWEAVGEEYITADEGHVEISVQSDSDSNQVLFTFRDNGIGMPQEVVRNVFLSFGKTLNGKNDSTVGRFGLGVASYPNLVGFEDGRLWLETVSRETGEKTVGWYTIDGLYEYTENVPDLKVMDEGEYGTAYKAWLKEDISMQDVIHWTERVSDYNSIPITLTVNGSEKHFGTETVYDKFDSHKHLFIEYEEEGIFKAVAGHDVPDDCVIIHRKMDFDLGSDIPFRDNVFLKLYTEEQKVCAGPHKGKIVVSPNRYQSLTESERNNKYITKDQLSENTPVTPRIVGNRESLDDSNGFKEYVSEKLMQMHCERVESILASLEENCEFFELPHQDQSYLKLALSNTIDDRKYRYNKYTGKIDDEFSQISRVGSILGDQTTEGYEIPENVEKYLYALFDSTEIQSTPLISTRRHSRKTIRPIEIIEKCRGYNNTIYMGCSRDQKKYDAVTDHNQNNVFVKVNSASVYELYEEVLGWKKLKDVKKSYVEEHLTVSDETKKKFGIGKFDKKSSSKKDTVIHFGRKQRNKKRYHLSELARDGAINSKIYGDTLIVFPQSTDKQISNFYAYANREMGLLTLTDSEYQEYLQGVDEVYTIDEIIDEHESTEVQTLHSTRELGNVLQDKTCLVVQSTESFYDRLLNVDRTELADRLLTVVRETQITSSRELTPDKYTDIAVLPDGFILSHQFALANCTNSIVYTINSAVPAPVQEETLVAKRNTERLQVALILAPWANTEIYNNFVDDAGRVQNLDSLTTHMYKSLGGENTEILPDRWG